jgi:hypothetical protein
MKYIFTLIFFALFSVTAYAAGLEWTVNSTSGSVTYTAPTVSDAEMDRFLDYLWDNFAPVDENGDQLVRNNANQATAFRTWAAANWQNTKRTVVDYERQRDADVARDAVTDIVESP